MAGRTHHSLHRRLHHIGVHKEYSNLRMQRLVCFFAAVSLRPSCPRYLRAEICTAMYPVVVLSRGRVTRSQG